jgi:hypothetical protein
VKATGSKDTIRNWKRAVDSDRVNGTSEASATTIKLNQVEAVIGIELARNGSGAAAENQLRSALLAYGIDKEELPSVLKAIRGFVEDASAGEPPRQDHPRDQSGPASPRRERVP